MMNLMTRRGFVAGIPGVLLAAQRSAEIRVEEIHPRFEDFRYRAPYKFGGKEVDRVTLLNVDCVVSSRDGKRSKGFAAMSLGNVWAWPSRPYDETLAAMKSLAGAIARITGDSKLWGHPIDINVTLEPEYLRTAGAMTNAAMPKLAMLVTASPFDAAIHDAYGKLHGRSSWHTYGPDFLRHDLAHYLGDAYKGETLDRYVLRDPKPSVALYHSVGASDPIVAADIKKRIGDGLPETLPEWIAHDRITHIKIKLNGDDLKWDIDRVVAIDAAADVAKFYCLDFNERCPNVGYLIEFLRKLRERSPRAYDRIQYIEQPTARDLKADRANVMHEAAKLKPVVIDESLTDVESLMLARDMGYTGAALKACKGQSQVLLMAAAAQKHKMFLCVQDLTCPGAALIHSAGLAAHIPGVAGIEANAREYVPAANAPWADRFPGIFKITAGTMHTDALTGPGLGIA
jgi:L-alanine-DL-glutamate epimerase-like enolase superfamily enzyme